MIVSSQSFKDCEQKRKHEPAYYYPRDGESSVQVHIQRIAGRAELSLACAGHLSDVHQGGITAVFTVVLSLFTIGLYRETAGLRRAADLQKIDTAEALKVARESSHVERAWMFFDNFEHGDGTGQRAGSTVTNIYHIKLVWKNGGRTPAIGTRTYVDHKITGALDPIPEFKPDFAPVRGSVVGQNTTIFPEMVYVYGDDYNGFVSGDKVVYIYSAIEYFDVFKSYVARRSEYTAVFSINGTLKVAYGPPTKNLFCKSVGSQNGCT